MKHILKIQKKYWEAVNIGLKTFEVRKYDRNYMCGDTIQFIVKEGKETLFEDKAEYGITYILFGGEYGLADDYCVMAIQRVGEQK